MQRFVRQSLAMGAGAVLAVFAGAGAWAQNAPAAENASATTSQHMLQMVPTVAQLNKTIDAKKAKQGDVVTARLQQPAAIPDQQTLPKNTVLEGHVDQVTASQHKSDSTVVITFDKAKLKDGKELPIKATVMKVYEPVFMTQQAQQGGGGGAPAGGMAPSMPSGGGGSAGAGGGSAPAPPPTPMNTPEPSGAGQAQQAGQQPQAGVPGVTLQSDIHQQSSATFTSKGRNVKVPSGTQMEVALAVIPPGVKLQQ